MWEKIAVAAGGGFIALKLAKAHHLDLPVAAATKKQYDRMIKAGLGGLDKSGVAELTFKNRIPGSAKAASVTDGS